MTDQGQSDGESKLSHKGGAGGLKSASVLEQSRVSSHVLKIQGGEPRIPLSPVPYRDAPPFHFKAFMTQSASYLVDRFKLCP